MFDCKICQREFKTKLGLCRHVSRTHKITTKEYTLKYLLDGVHPTCACGCGKETSYVKEVPLTFSTYCTGHYAKHHPEIWGDKSDPERLKKSAKTFKERYAKGEIKNPLKGKTKHNCEHIKKLSELSRKDVSPHRVKAISEFMKNYTRTPEHQDKLNKSIKEGTNKPEYREECRQRKMNFLINNHKQYTSKLEDYFIENYLTPNNILFKRNFYAKGIKSFYDFYLPEFNVIIEVDGDYWHCNPKIFPEAKYASQKRNIIKDVIKNEWAIENGYTIVRFWEKDIKEEPGTVLNKLVEIGVILDKNPK